MASDNNDAIPEINIKARQVGDKAHVEVEVPVGPSEHEQKKTAQEREAAREERRRARQERQKAHEKEKEAEKKEDEDDSKGFTIAGYTLGELAKAPAEPPDEKEVGKRSPKTDD